MRTTTTIILLLAVLGLALTWYFLPKTSSEHTDVALGRPLLHEVAADDIQIVDIRDASGVTYASPLTLTRQDDHWTMKSPAVGDGTKTRARTPFVTSLLTTLQDVRARRVIEPDANSTSLARKGLDAQRRVRVTITSKAGKEHYLDLGSTVGEGDWACTVNDSNTVYAIGAELKGDLLPNPADIEDPFLVHISPLEVQVLRIEEAGEVQLEVERSFSRWFIRKPVDGIPADGMRTDSLRQQILTLKAQIRFEGDTAPSFPDEPAGRFTIVDRSGREHWVEWAPVGSGRLLVRTSDRRKPLGMLESSIKNITTDWPHYRDRRLMGLTTNQIIRVEVDRQPAVKDQDSFELRRANERDFVFFRVNGVPRKLLHADPIDAAAFLESLRTLEAHHFTATDDSFESEFRVKVLAALSGSQQGVQRVLEIGPAKEGYRPVRVTGVEGLAWVAEEAPDFLRAPVHKLLERVAWCTDGYFRLKTVVTQVDDSERREFSGTLDPGTRELLLRGQSPDGKLMEIPSTTTAALTTLMVGGMKIDRWMGPGTADHSLFKNPKLVLEWFEPEGATPESLPDNQEGVTRRLIIGQKGADGLYPGIVLPDPSLIFMVDQAGLRPIITLHDFGR